MATFQEIADDISTELNQGTTLDAIILKKVYAAHRFLELNNNFEYMKVWDTITQPADVLTIVLPIGFKRMHMLRYDYESRFLYLEKVDPVDALEPEADRPKFWHLTAATTGRLWRAFDAETEITVVYTGFRQTYTPGLSDWLTIVGQEAVMFKALMSMAGPSKDPELKTLYKDDYVEALSTVLLADEEMERSVQSPEFRYGQEY